MPGGFWKLMLCFDSVIFLIPESIMWVSLGLHHDFSSMLHTVNYFFSSVFDFFLLLLFFVSCTHSHTATSLLNFLSHRCSPKLDFPPLRGQADQPSAMEVRGNAVEGKKLPLFFIAKRNGWKAVSFESLKRKINYRNERRSHKKHARGQNFV